MPNATPPRKRGQAGRAARTRFVEIENTLAQPPRAATTGLIIEAEGLRLLLADRAAVAILADLLGLVPARGKGGRP
jgi:hypothetical protein